MTAEIAILNKTAVALAADSTVTIGGSENSRAKTYQSVNKVFTLSKRQPIGIMIYGNAALMGVPWETLIKQYRSQLAGSSFPTVTGYAEDFISFLERSTTIFDDALQRKSFTVEFAGYLGNHILPAVADAVKKQIGSGTTTARQIGQIAAQVIRSHWELLSKVPLLPGFTSRFEGSLIKTYSTEINNAAAVVFKSTPLSDATRRYLGRISARIFCGTMFPEDILSGVVIAGFGDDQVFPQIATFAPHCLVRNRLIFRLEENMCHAISHEEHSALMPLAQREVVDTFLRGIDDEYLKIVYEAMETLSSGFPAIAAQYLSGHDDVQKMEIAKKIGEETKKLAEAFRKNLETHRDKKHVGPMLQIIGILPKNELAEMAEALVSLTSLKRKMSTGLETVGGPIDVGVISKGDGFIWIRRKHYFKPELNPHFVRNYMRELDYATTN